MASKGKLFGERLILGVDGVYPDPELASLGTDGTRLFLKDTEVGEKSLAEVWNHVATHGILDHPDTLDLMLDYVLKTEFYSLLEDDEHPVPIGLGGDIGGNRLLSGHVADSGIHQRKFKYTVRVGKSGGDYSSIQAAIDAIPSSGPDAPGPNQRWVVHVGPGLWEEAVTLNREWVILFGGAGWRSTVIRWDSTSDGSKFPLLVTVGNSAAFGFSLIQLKATYTSPALVLGPLSGSGFDNCVIEDCYIEGQHADPVIVGGGWTNSLLRRSHVKGMYDNVSTYSSIWVDQCVLEATNAPSGAVIWASGAAAVRVTRCTAKGTVGAWMTLDSGAAVYIDGCVWAGSSSTVPALTSYNGSGTVHAGSVAARRESTAGTITVQAIPVPGVDTKGKVRAAWRDTGFGGAEMGFGIDSRVTLATGGYTGNDVVLRRRFDLINTHSLGGYIWQLDEDSANYGSGSLTSGGLTIDLGASAGQFWRTYDKVLGVTIAGCERNGLLFSRGGGRLEAASVTANGGLSASPDLVLRGAFDSDPGAGVTSAWRDAAIRHTLTAGGAAPASQLEFLIAGAMKAALNDQGELSGCAWKGATVGAAFGGTGLTEYTKGDLIAATGASALGKVAVGADGASVVADSSQATGLGYAERSRLIYVNTANSSQLANFGVWTNFDLGVELPANFWAVGRTLEVTAQGVYSTAVAASIQLGLYLGSTKVSQFGSQSTSNGWSAINWLYRIVLVCRAVGSSGVVAFSWGLHCPYGFAAGTAGDISVNLTSALWLRPAFYCSVADAGNTATCRHFAVLRA
jgi:hypothetical protein